MKTPLTSLASIAVLLVCSLFVAPCGAQEITSNPSDAGRVPGSVFGDRVSPGSALKGYLYDPKKLKNGVGNASYYKNGLLGVLSQIIKGQSMRTGSLQKYLRSKKPLYATHFLMPVIEEDKYSYMPRAFDSLARGPELIVLYKGKVRAPKSGKFRFIGIADDLIAVSINGKVVLEAGYIIASEQPEVGDKALTLGKEKEYRKSVELGVDRLHKGYEFLPYTVDYQNRLFGGLTAGKPFKVEAGEVYPIEILYADKGGWAHFFLVIEDLSRPEGERGRPPFDLFRTANVSPTFKSISLRLKDHGCPLNTNVPKTVTSANRNNIPEYNPNSPIWEVVE